MFLVGVTQELHARNVSKIFKQYGIKTVTAYSTSKNKLSLIEYKNMVSADTDIMAVSLKESNIPLCRDVVFDFVIACDGAQNNLGTVLCADSVVLLNADNKQEQTSYGGAVIITYGLNSKSTVTASSIETGMDCLEFNYCVQRTIMTFMGKEILPQEFPVKLNGFDQNHLHDALAAVTVLVMSELI